MRRPGLTLLSVAAVGCGGGDPRAGGGTVVSDQHVASQLRFEVAPVAPYGGVRAARAAVRDARVREHLPETPDGLLPQPDFAGSLRVVRWPEPGGAGTTLALVDVRDGAVHSGATDATDATTRADSRLMRFAPPRSDRPGGVACAGCTEGYALWTGQDLRLLPPALWLDPPDSPWPDTEPVLSLRAEEPQVLARTEGRLVRARWDRLALARGDGGWLGFHDDFDDHALRAVHVLRAYLPALRAVVVERAYVPEGRTLLLVSLANGDSLEVDEVPVLAPGGAHAVTASADVVAGHLPNRVRVYGVQGERLVVELELEPRGWGAHEPVWASPDTLRLTRIESPDGGPPRTAGTLVLVRDGPGWRPLG